jgi:hypothetical protein
LLYLIEGAVDRTDEGNIRKIKSRTSLFEQMVLGIEPELVTIVDSHAWYLRYRREWESGRARGREGEAARQREGERARQRGTERARGRDSERARARESEDSETARQRESERARERDTKSPTHGGPEDLSVISPVQYSTCTSVTIMIICFEQSSTVLV